jgi:hypothetical protein
MGQRYTPSKLGIPIINDTDNAGLYPDSPMLCHEFNTLLVVAIFGEPGGSASIRPWVNIKSTIAGTTESVDNWVPLADVTIQAVDDSDNAPTGIVNGFRASPVEIALPNCHEVQVELLDVLPGTTTLAPTSVPGVDPGMLTLWAKPANRAPR